MPKFICTQCGVVPCFLGNNELHPGMPDRCPYGADELESKWDVYKDPDDPQNNNKVE